MRAIDRFALSFTPMLLRLVIGATFLWSGAGKLFHHTELSDPDRAIITQLEGGAPAPTNQAPPAEPLPEPDPEAETGDAPAEDSEEEPARPRLRSLTDPNASALPSGYSLTLAQDSAPDQGLDTLNPNAETTEEAVGEALDAITDEIEDAAAEFVGANPTRERFLVNVALTTYKAANPEKGSPRVPAFMGDNALVLAWGVAIIEFVGGVCLILGFLTRFWAVMITGVIAGALWITELGPAMLGGLDQTFLGFLPPVWPFNPAAAMHFLWLLLLTISAFSLVFLGAGALSIDRFLFGHPLNKVEVYTPPKEDDD